MLFKRALSAQIMASCLQPNYTAIVLSGVRMHGLYQNAGDALFAKGVTHPEPFQPSFAMLQQSKVTSSDDLRTYHCNQQNTPAGTDPACPRRREVIPPAERVVCKFSNLAEVGEFTFADLDLYCSAARGHGVTKNLRGGRNLIRFRDTS